jgi:eukaryotic-like serine/threonine-protein kinase
MDDRACPGIMPASTTPYRARCIGAEGGAGRIVDEVTVADQPVPGELLADRYRFEAQIGRGGAGAVWRAQDELLDRAVAIKLLHADVADDPVASQRFRHEATAAAKLAHPHVVTVYDIGSSDGREHLVMELVDGPSLADLLGHGPLAPGIVAEIGRAIAAALGAAHARGLVHRDVKPANVLFTREGIAKVADFGIARALGGSASRLTLPGSVMGTARYLSPEQLRDDPVDARADVYSLGLVLHEALTGRQPWGEGNAAEVAARRLTGDLTPPAKLVRDVPPALDATIQRATRRDPEQRHLDGAAFASTLAPLADDHARRALARVVGGDSASAAGGAPIGHAPTPPTRPGGAPVAAHSRPAPPPTAGSKPVRRRRKGRLRRSIGRSLLALVVLAAGLVGYLGLTDAGLSFEVLGDADRWEGLARSVRDQFDDWFG